MTTENEKMEVKRYDFCWDINGGKIVENPGGDYVKFDDVEETLTHIPSPHLELMELLDECEQLFKYGGGMADRENILVKLHKIKLKYENTK